MKNSFYRPEAINTREFDRIVEAMRSDLSAFRKGQVSVEDQEVYIRELILAQKILEKDPRMGFWGFSEPHEMPGDSRVEYFYKPTYIATGIMMVSLLQNPELRKMDGFDETMTRALMGSKGRNFLGNGHDSKKGLLEALDIFLDAGADIFIDIYPDYAKEFNLQLLLALAHVKLCVEKENFLGDWGESYEKEYRALWAKAEGRSLVFVYGTLQRGNSNYSHYLKESSFISAAVLEGYRMHDLGYYPGIREEEGSSVKGEVFLVTPTVRENLDRLEGEGSLYKRRLVPLNIQGAAVQAHVYEYLQDTRNTPVVSFNDQPWRRK